jgi:hypothetical protein
MLLPVKHLVSLPWQSTTPAVHYQQLGQMPQYLKYDLNINYVATGKRNKEEYEGIY